MEQKHWEKIAIYFGLKQKLPLNETLIGLYSFTIQRQKSMQVCKYGACLQFLKAAVLFLRGSGCLCSCHGILGERCIWL